MTRLSLTGAHWAIPAVDVDRIQRLQAELGLGPTAARCLALRWPADAPLGKLDPSLDDLIDPFEMLNMAHAVDRLKAAIRDKQRIRVITDYDVDGTTSSLILQAALRILDPKVDLSFHIPNRFEEGYGFSVAAAEKAHTDGVQLIVTADIGVRDHAAVQAARNAGIDVLICDHHLPAGESVPEDATVLCPPQLGDDYPNGSLAACGVSLKLAQALVGHHPKWHAILLSLLKLAAVGTVADLVPLTTRENRAIVALGLQQLNRSNHHAGLQALLEVSKLKPGEIRETDLGFRIGPRINAAGRVADASLVVELLNCREAQRSAELAQTLDRLNRERRDIQRKLTEQALEAIGDEPDPFVVVAGAEEDGWHRGVVGIVASKIKDTVHRPTAVVSIQGDTAVGSVRSITGLHAVQALDSVADLLVKYGGHPAAAGFTVPTDKLDALRERLGAFVEANTDDEMLVRKRRGDANAPIDEVDEQLYGELRALGPFGMGNPEPRLLIEGVEPLGMRALGADGKTLKFLIPRPTGGSIEALWFGQGERIDELAGKKLDLLATLGENVWKGRRTLQLVIQDAREHG